MSGRPSVYIGETLAMVTVRNSNSYWIRILPPTGVLSIDRLRPSRIYAVAYTIERDTMHFWPKVMKLVCTRCTLLKFGENNFILVEIIDSFRYPRWRLPSSWTFFKMCTSDTTDRYKLVPGVLCKQLLRIFILVESTDIFRYPRWRPPPSLILNILLFYQWGRRQLVPSIRWWNLVRTASSVRKLFTFW